ncbi:MAG: hypothetical protein JW912_07330 [Sedimentisphaerales bacterium]|nr:hypothetical protein [Sedimentisphaerales bacterium]
MESPHKQVTNLLVVIFFSAFLLTGCSEPIRKASTGLCPRIKDSAQAIAKLNQDCENTIAIKAGGRMILEYYDDRDDLQKHNLDITLRFYPPDRLFFRGIVFPVEVVRLGTNSSELWVMFSPKEMSRYYWGQRPEADVCLKGQVLSPGRMIEAMGVVNVDTEGTLTSLEQMDVLTLNLKSGKMKRIYIDRCDSLIKMIEYLDAGGNIETVTELDDYQKVGNSFVPAKVVITELQNHTYVELNLRNIKPFEPTEAQLEGKLFKRPEPKGFKDVYKLTGNCRLEVQQITN